MENLIKHRPAGISEADWKKIKNFNRVMETKKYLEHWILRLVSPECFKVPFDDWMGDFYARYTSGQLELMRRLWIERRKRILFSGKNGI